MKIFLEMLSHRCCRPGGGSALARGFWRCRAVVAVAPNHPLSSALPWTAGAPGLAVDHRLLQVTRSLSPPGRPWPRPKPCSPVFAEGSGRARPGAIDQQRGAEAADAVLPPPAGGAQGAGACVHMCAHAHLCAHTCTCVHMYARTCTLPPGVSCAAGAFPQLQPLLGCGSCQAPPPPTGLASGRGLLGAGGG